MSIRACMTTLEREKKVSALKNPGRINVQVLVISTTIAATAYNLQYCCSVVVFMDVPSTS